jgi:hypothetical protein
MNQLQLPIGADAALNLVAACDCALTALGCPALESGLPIGEINHAMIQLRWLRKELLRQRGDALNAAISRARGKAND